MAFICVTWPISYMSHAHFTHDHFTHDHFIHIHCIHDHFRRDHLTHDHFRHKTCPFHTVTISFFFFRDHPTHDHSIHDHSIQTVLYTRQKMTILYLFIHKILHAKHDHFIHATCTIDSFIHEALLSQSPLTLSWIAHVSYMKPLTLSYMRHERIAHVSCMKESMIFCWEEKTGFYINIYKKRIGTDWKFVEFLFITCRNDWGFTFVNTATSFSVVNTVIRSRYSLLHLECHFLNLKSQSIL